MPQYTVYVQDQGLSAATALTQWLLATTATRQLKIREWGVSFDGTNATNVPVKVELARYTSAGTATAFTPRKFDDPNGPASICTAQTAFTAEPTISDIVFPARLTPNGGLLVMQYAQDERPLVPVSSWIGLRLTAPAAVNATSYVVFEE